MKRHEEKRAQRRQRQRSKQKSTHRNLVLERCGLCGEETKHAAAHALFMGDDGSLIPYIVCPTCFSKDLAGENANPNLAAQKAEFNLIITEPEGGVH